MHSPKASPLLVQTRRLLRQFNLSARKRLGQHFLIEEKVLQDVATSAELSPTDVVVEIGPGLGILTKELASQAGQVIAVEIDSKIAAALRQILAPFNNVTIINEDILQIEPEALLQEKKASFTQATNGLFIYKVVANLPYYITSPVLRHFLESPFKPQVMVVMVQKEVAKVIAAEPGQTSVLSISVQFYGQPKIIRYVPASCFYPAPEVDSAILRIDLYPQPVLPPSDEASFFDLVRAGFSASRKQLANSLAQGLRLPKAEVASLLQEADISPQRRAETLTLAEWKQLWQVFTRSG